MTYRPDFRMNDSDVDRVRTVIAETVARLGELDDAATEILFRCAAEVLGMIPSDLTPVERGFIEHVTYTTTHPDERFSLVA